MPILYIYIYIYTLVLKYSLYRYFRVKVHVQKYVHGPLYTNPSSLTVHTPMEPTWYPQAHGSSRIAQRSTVSGRLPALVVEGSHAVNTSALKCLYYRDDEASAIWAHEAFGISTMGF